MKGKSRNKSTASQKELKKALIKRAFGYDATEIIEEYGADEDGQVKLLKKKVTQKNVPPDITALKILLEDSEMPLDEMSDEQLEQEKQRLLALLWDSEKQKKENKIAKK